MEGKEKEEGKGRKTKQEPGIKNQKTILPDSEL